MWGRLATFALLAGALVPARMRHGRGWQWGGAAARDFNAADYYPLMSGWKWAYDVEKDGMNILAIYVSSNGPARPPSFRPVSNGSPTR